MENRRAGELIGAIVVFFVALFVYTKFVGPIPFTVNNINTLNSTPFEVEGTGKAAAVPDTAVISIGINQTGASVQEAQEKTNRVSQKVAAGLKEQGIEEKNIKTTDYSVNPTYSSIGDSQKVNGYSVTQSFEVKVPIGKANAVVDSATSNEANLVGGINFTLNDAKEAELTNAARQEAVNKAKASAQGLAKASGIKLGNIINVRETSGGVRPIPLAFDTKSVSAEGTTTPTNITPGQSNVEITVVLTYQVN